MEHNPEDLSIFRRKDEHVDLALAQDTARRRSAHFDQVSFVPNPLAAIDIDKVQLGTQIAGSNWEIPFFINAMTGGSLQTGKINHELAQVAAETKIAIACGSMSAYFKDPSCAISFKVLREQNPHGFVMANLSANASVDQAKAAVELLEANALQIHLNPVQEIVMPEGDRHFSHHAKQIEQIVKHVKVPVIVKEVGFGMSSQSIYQLAALGVKTVDVGGKGGTNFAQIENSRRQDDFSLLDDWGFSAVVSLLDTFQAAEESGTEILASGGVRNPLDVVKALGLGARAVGVAGGFLATLKTEGTDALIKQITNWQEQIRSIMALIGIDKVEKLTNSDLIITGEVQQIARARNLNISSRKRSKSKES